MKQKNALYWIWLSLVCGAASKDAAYLCSQYEDPFELYRLDEDELSCMEHVSAVTRERLGDKSLDEAYSILNDCHRDRVDIIPYADPRYPVRLRTIENPPVLLYCLGRLPDLNQRLCVAMVGTRRMSEYGRQAAYRIAYELSASRVVVVSGMALGVDAVSACGALEAGGTTVAVLGCGLRTVYPKEHKDLMDAIVRQGAVITEYPPYAKPCGYHFPQRNRIISGLSQGVLVVEGNMGSGALITASHAVAQGRDLFALPGKIDETSSDGPNELIRQGANIVLAAEDILCFYDFLYHKEIRSEALNKAKRHSSRVDEGLRRYGVDLARCRVEPSSQNEEMPNGEGTRVASPPKKKSAPETAVPISDDTTHADAPPAPTSEAADGHPDCSEELLASVDATTRRVFSLMPTDKAVTPDHLAAEGIDIGDVITSLTLLEIVGLISTLPGGMYVRR